MPGGIKLLKGDLIGSLLWLCCRVAASRPTGTMVLNDLTTALTSAFSRLSRAPASADDATLHAVLKEITTALLQSDVNVKLQIPSRKP